MGMTKKFIATTASALMFSIVGVGQASGDGIEVTISEQNPFVDFSALSAGEGYQVDVAQGNGDPSVQLYSNSAPTDYYTSNNGLATPNLISENDDFNSLSSRISGTVASGNYTIRISWCGWFCYGFPDTVAAGLYPYTQTFTLTYTGFTGVAQLPSVYINPRASNALRVDTVGTITENANTISCSPGTYKFLNGGSTEEAQNLGVLVYTLVVDGKAVSRLGAGSYASLPSHLFPAITQSVSGSADMKGATWDVSALKNFDARCEIYAWQSGGNIQSSSAQISDAVKTAEIAAKAKAFEDQRAAANAANFTKEARELRKRIAARSGK